jgi:hypothetical protein
MYFHTKFFVPSFNVSLATAIKSKAEYEFHARSMFCVFMGLLHILGPSGTNVVPTL